ncbi:MAG: SUMF1/EgtB/PvdO family nonheme iron enzyme [Planctomycetota bacterium]|nr:SUMF1/EgtB/PvdO family nonheme iron enzyme [Planctomycetota bacterium]
MFSAAGAEMKTECWDNTQAGFNKMAERIDAQNGRNLLARAGVKVFGDAPSPRELADGSAGVMGGDGRVNIDGQPSVIAFYLGQPKPLHEVGVFTFNCDPRANQDFEIRVAENSNHPGKLPKFSDAPLLTTGDKILGKDGGGFHTSFVSADGGPLAAEKVDWIEFRIWRTYPEKAGSPAKTNRPQGWTAVVELEAFGEPNDVIVVTPEEKARAAALRQLGDRPPYEKKATWQETMQATREAMLRWECEIDGMVQQRAGVNFGNWYTAGVVPANGDEARQIERLSSVDLAAPLALKGKQLAWRECAEVKDGELADLAAILKAKPGEVVVLCRKMDVEAEYAGKEALAVGVGMASGRLKVVGGKSTIAPNDNSPAQPNQRTWPIHESPGHYHLLAMVPVNKGGQCDLWLMLQPPMSKPGAGPRQERISRRQQLYERVKKDFPDPVSLTQIGWEQADSIWVSFERRAMAGREYFTTDWAPGKPQTLVSQYNTFAEIRAGAVSKELETIEAGIRARAEPCLAAFKTGKAAETLEEARKRYYAIATLQNAMAEHHRIESMRLAVKDQQETFGEKYPKGAEFLKRIDALEEQMTAAWAKVAGGGGAADALAAVVAVHEKAATEGKEILLANPLLAFDKLLLGRGGPGFASNWGGPNHIGNELVTLSPVKPDGTITPIYRGGGISDMDLSFDGTKILFSENVRIHEVNVDGTGHRQITTHTDQHTKHYEVCRMPSGQIMFVSTACEQAVPCTGEWYVGNMHLINDDGTNERRLCFDQDHDWNPCVMENGQVIYTRWEYTDTPHYFTRLLFTMNPDGSNQTAFYGSNSYWPNAMYWPKPIPGKPTQIVCVVSGHHGVSRVGQLVVLDASRGRQEASGIIHRIGDRGKTVEPVIMDGLVAEWWPRFAWPYPLSEPETNRGSGNYFLANCKLDEWSPWGIYLVDIFDNMTPLLIGNYAEPIPLRPRPTPAAIPPRVDPKRKDALVYMANVYQGGGLRGYPQGSVKALRLGSHEYRFGDNGDTYAATYEGGWDVKLILGTVPVEPDGSAFFRVPANTPIFVQPLDADGKSLQVMRSWFTAMPGEVLSCVGCHESQNQAPPTYQASLSRMSPSEIKPWYGPARGFGFEHEVQPVLNHRCVGCHDGQNKDGRQKPDFRGKQLRPEFKGNYSPAYMALAPYVRRAGYEADYHLPAPAEFHASTSALVQMLEKGHHNVTLTQEERDRIYTWIDFNVPYAGNWRESHRPPKAEQVERRAKYRLLLSNVEDRTEDPLPQPAAVAFEQPAPEAARPTPVKLEGWPLTAQQAAELQKQTGLSEMKLDLGEGVSITLVPVPAGKFVMGDVNGFPDEFPDAAVGIGQPFYIGRMEVTNRQYAQFDPTHDSAYMEGRGKDRYTRGTPVNEPDQPVVRISWKEAVAFCEWLSQKTRIECSLPTEAQWEWACRAGSATPWSFGESCEKAQNVGNVADSSLSGWGWGRVDRYSDGAMFSIPGGRYKPNAWGIHDMVGNVAEWTLTEYRAYPYVDGDGRNDPKAEGPKVVRGGSWNDTFRYCRSASRWRYLPCQPVYNVGFRIVCKPSKVAATK